MKAGDEAAFGQVVRDFGPQLLAVARRFLQHEQDAQDALQDAMLSAFRGIDKFEGQSRLSTWLHRIVVNSALMKLRSRKRKRERPIEDLMPKYKADGTPAGVVQDWATSFDTAVHDRELRQWIRDSIDQLPESYRTVLLLRDIEQRNTEETARLLDLSPSAVKTRLHRARIALRTLLKPQMVGGVA